MMLFHRLALPRLSPSSKHLGRVIQLLLYPLQPFLGQGSCGPEAVKVSSQRIQGCVGVSAGQAPFLTM